jgi:flagellar biogenesis protein FliO
MIRVLEAALGALAVMLVSVVSPAGEAAEPLAAEHATAQKAAAEGPAAVTETSDTPTHALAGTEEESDSFLSYEEPIAAPQHSFASLMLRLVLSMAIIIGLIYGGLMLVKLLARKAKVTPKTEKLIRIVDRTMLDPKRAIYLVKVVDRLLVVGVGATEIRTLAEIDDETVVGNIQETEFTGHLQSLLGRLAGRQN